MIPYIDVRGPQPILFIGLLAFVLEGQDRGITVVQALVWLATQNILVDIVVL